MGAMKWLLAVVLSASLAFAQKAPADFAFHMAGGADLKLSQYRGKVVVVAFLNTGCSHCQAFAKQLSLYQAEYGPKGVQVIAAVFDKEAKQGLEKFRTQFVKGYPLGYSDEATVMQWLAQPLEQGYFVPIVAFVDKKGALESKHLGDDMLFQDPDGNIRHKLDLLMKKP
ncbi:MAG: TlpA family protein disulfide reductase [Acidobacteriia bacterium]|nr:TlpA family protein disulfide reductase [Terriglobia bacterium]